MASQKRGPKDLTDLPYELQIRILTLLDQKDHVALHRTSKTWRDMIIHFMTDFNAVKIKDWRWYCRHKPSIPFCPQCLDKIQNKRGLGDDWNWWL